MLSAGQYQGIIAGKYEKKIFALEKKIATLTDQIEKLKQFVASRGTWRGVCGVCKITGAKILQSKKLEEKKADVAEQNRQEKDNTTGNAG